MLNLNGLPTILGTGVSALAISHHLTKAGIRHVLVGPEPTDVPRFGESLDITGAMEFRDEFADRYQEFTGKKNSVDFWAWGSVANQSTLLAKAMGRFGRVLELLSGYRVPESLWHLERVGFDRALYNDVCKSRLCHRLSCPIPEVIFDAQEDRVTALNCQGRVILPSFVFDTSSVVSGISKCLGGAISSISKPLVAAFSHLENPLYLRHHDWQHRTTIFLLRAETDGIDALLSFIPVRDIISLIITTEAIPGLDAQTIHDRAIAGMARRGFPYPGLCAVRTGPRLVPHQYFMQERVVGKNWFMGGPPSGGIWFPSSSGVGLGLLAGRLAPKILRNPKKYGERYHTYLKGLMKTHWWYHRYRRDVPTPGNQEALLDLYDTVTQLNLQRTLAYVTARGLILPQIFGKLFIFVVNKKWLLKHFCTLSTQSAATESHEEVKKAANND